MNSDRLVAQLEAHFQPRRACLLFFLSNDTSYPGVMENFQLAAACRFFVGILASGASFGSASSQVLSIFLSFYFKQRPSGRVLPQIRRQLPRTFWFCSLVPHKCTASSCFCSTWTFNAPKGTLW